MKRRKIVLSERIVEDIKDKEIENINWIDVMVPFSDLMTLLLVFFVFFFMFSKGFEQPVDVEAKSSEYTEKPVEAGGEYVIRIGEKILFDTGKAIIKKEAYPVLSSIAKKVVKMMKEGNYNQIRVEGHTDNVPIRYANYDSNWELSTARALSVVEFFIDKYKFSPDQLQAMGYGEYKPLVSNDSPENRARNRRVEIKLVKTR